MKKFSNQIRIRTKEELEGRKDMLLELSDLLNTNGVAHFLCLGALLGAVREKYFIPWDWDVELGVYTKDVFDRKEELLRILTDAGFTILKKDFSFANFKIDIAKSQPKEVSSYTIMGWHKEGDMWRRNMFQIPAASLDTLDDIPFLGRTFKCPHLPEQYLAYQYGKDWRTPKRTDDPDEYWTREAFPKGDVTRGGRLGVFVRRMRKSILDTIGNLIP